VAKNRTIKTSAATDNPTFSININGKEITQEIHILSIIVSKLINKISSARVTLLDGIPAQGDFPLSNSKLFIPGNKIEILAGYHSKEKTIFNGIIVSHSIKTRTNSASTLTIECKHEAYKLNTGRSCKYYYDSTDSDMFESLIDSYSIEREVDSTKTKHKEMVQYYCSDWDFIVNRSDLNGLIVLTNNNKIEIKKPNLNSGPVLSLLYGATIYEITAEIDSRTQLQVVQSKSWDYPNHEVLESDADEPNDLGQGNLNAEDLSKISMLKRYSLIHSGQLNESELKTWADAKLLKSRLAKVRGTVKFQGTWEVNPGNIIELAGVGERFNGKAYVSGIRHEFGNGMWYTIAQFGVSPRWFHEENDINSAKAPGLGSAINGLQIGVVTNLEDPGGENRIQIWLPTTHENINSIWARISSLDAGANRGAFWMPEVGDEVITGFIDDDPNNAVILGMLYSSAKPPPIALTSDNHEKGFVTRDEIKFLFNDNEKSVCIETPKGKKILINDNNETISIEDEYSNKISMDSEGVIIKSSKDLILKAEKNLNLIATNTEIKATSKFKAEGMSSSEVSSTGQAILKGSIVQIN